MTWRAEPARLYKAALMLALKTGEKAGGVPCLPVVYRYTLAASYSLAAHSFTLQLTVTHSRRFTSYAASGLSFLRR